MKVNRASAMVAPWACVALVLFVSCVVVACGEQQPSPTPPAAGPAPTITVPIDLPVVISISGAIDDQVLGALDEQIAAFEAANRDVFVEVVKPVGDAGAIREELMSYLAQGDPSRDIYVVPEGWVSELAEEGWLARLDAYVEDATAYAITYNGVVVGLRWPLEERALVLSAGSDSLDRALRFMAFMAEMDR